MSCLYVFTISSSAQFISGWKERNFKKCTDQSLSKSIGPNREQKGSTDRARI